MTMTAPFMRAYTELLVATCHRRGAFAMGGMAAFIPSRRDPEVNESALAKVREDKEREAGDGFDGSWVAHPDLVPICREIFDRVLGDRPNQLDRQRAERAVTADSCSTWPRTGGAVTEAGLRGNVSVALQYLEAWLRGNGAVAIHNLMEDAATAEISRSQVWQWIHNGVRLDDGTAITADLVGPDRGRGAGQDPRRRSATQAWAAAGSTTPASCSSGSRWPTTSPTSSPGRLRLDRLTDAADRRDYATWTSGSPPHDAFLAARYPGERAGRQPVHTVYVPADRWPASATWGADALAAMDDRPASPPERRPGPGQAAPREPIEDLRVDFEDGYGVRDDDAGGRGGPRGRRDPAATGPRPPFVGHPDQVARGRHPPPRACVRWTCS